MPIFEAMVSSKFDGQNTEEPTDYLKILVGPNLKQNLTSLMFVLKSLLTYTFIQVTGLIRKKRSFLLFIVDWITGSDLVSIEWILSMSHFFVVE